MGEWSIPPQWYKYNLPPTWIILEFVPPSFRGCYTLAYHYLWCCHVPNFIHPRTLNIGSGSPAMFAFGISGPLKNITSGQKGHNLVQVHCLFTLAWLLAYNTLPTYRISIAWFKGKSTGNHGFTHKKRVSDLRLTRILGLVKSHEVAIFIRFSIVIRHFSRPKSPYFSHLPGSGRWHSSKGVAPPCKSTNVRLHPEARGEGRINRALFVFPGRWRAEGWKYQNHVAFFGSIFWWVIHLNPSMRDWWPPPRMGTYGFIMGCIVWLI